MFCERAEKTSDANIIRIAKTAFPDYRGRKFYVAVQTRPFSVKSYWDGGSRCYFTFVDLRNGRTMAMPAQSAFDAQVGNAEQCVLPQYCACVQNQCFCGKWIGCTVILPSAQALEAMTKGVPLLLDGRL